MAGKQASAAESNQKPETNGAEPIRGAKTAAIRDLIAMGVKSARAIPD